MMKHCASKSPLRSCTTENTISSAGNFTTSSFPCQFSGNFIQAITSTMGTELLNSSRTQSILQLRLQDNMSTKKELSEQIKVHSQHSEWYFILIRVFLIVKIYKFFFIQISRVILLYILWSNTSQVFPEVRGFLGLVVSVG